MKNKKLVSLLALASCVILGGCNPNNTNNDTSGQNQDSGQNDGGSGGAEVSLSLKTLPVEIIVGEEFDLNSYIQLENATGYTIAIDATSKDLVDINDGKIVAKDEGTIKFTVTYGDLSAKGSIKAISKLRKEAVAQLGKASSEYVIYDTYYDEEDECDYIDTYVYHNPNYLISNDWDDENDLGGLIKFDSGFIYQFTKENYDDDFITVEKARFPRASYELYNAPFQLNVANFKYVREEVEGEVIEYLTWKEDSKYSVADFLFNTMAVRYEYDVSSLDLYGFEVEATDDTPAYTAFALSTVLSVPDYLLDDEGEFIDPEPAEPENYDFVDVEAAFEFVETNADYIADFKDAAVEKAIEDNLEPESESFDELKAVFDTVATAKNFTIYADYGWCGLNDDDTEYPYTETYFGEMAEYYGAQEGYEIYGEYPELIIANYYPFYPGSSTYKATDTQTHEVDTGWYLNQSTVYTMEGDESGYICHDGELYGYFFLPASSGYVESDGYYAQDAEVAANSLFGDERLDDLTLGGLVSSSDAWNDVWIDSREVEGDEVTLTFAASTATEFFFTLVANTVQGDSLISYFSDEGAEELEYVSITATVNTATNEVEFKITFDINFGPSVGTVRYYMDITLSDIGSTTIDPLTIDYDALAE